MAVARATTQPQYGTPRLRPTLTMTAAMETCSAFQPSMTGWSVSNVSVTPQPPPEPEPPNTAEMSTTGRPMQTTMMPAMSADASLSMACAFRMKHEKGRLRGRRAWRVTNRKG